MQKWARAGLERWVCLLGIALILLGGLVLEAAPHREVRVAVFPFLPGIFMDEHGEAKGFFVDMLKVVAAEEDWELRFVPGTWAEGLERAQRGEVDLLTSVAHTPERKLILDFGEEPAFTVWSILYANPKVTIESVMDVKGLRVGVMRNDVNGQHFQELCAQFNLPCTFVTLGTFPEVFSAVAAGRVDAGVTVSTFGYAKEAEYGVKRTPVVFTPFPIHFAVARGRNGAVLKALDGYLKTNKPLAGSSYHQAVDRWLSVGGRQGLPTWVLHSGAVVVGLLLVALVIIVVFRRKVRSATAVILELNAGLTRELAERSRKEELILNVASGVSATTGVSFFQELVCYLARASNCDFAFIGEHHVVQGVPRIQTLAMAVDGQASENVEYDVEGTPCERVLGGTFFVHSQGLQEAFPADGLLRQLGVESYVGGPLVASTGEVLGILAVMQRTALHNGSEVAALLRIFSARATAELERQKAERQQRALESQMQHAQKLESLGVLAGGIAHDFNNLLTAMLGHMNLAKAKLHPEAPAQPHLESVEAIIHRTADLTRQMLAYSGKGRFVVRAHDLNQVLTEMTHLLEVSISKKIALQYHLGEDLATIEADAAQIQQVVMNLVTNASDAIGDQVGTIRLHTSSMEADAGYLQQVFHGQNLEPGNYVVLEVTDTGCGMKPDVLARIFEPFFTTKVKGRGLGLSATSGILRGHKAGLKIYSEVGMGTTFRVLLPAGAGSPAACLQPDTAPEALPRALVLIVDDEEIIRIATTSLVEFLGLEAVTAVDGQDAVEQVQRNPGIDLVLMDLTMPRMDGREAFRCIRQHRPHLPVILSSGYNEQESIQDFLGRGLAGFLQKPYTLQALREKVGEALRAREA